ncbi:MAG: TolC family protein [Pseudobdellovibrionaceae bacterium]
MKKNKALAASFFLMGTFVFSPLLSAMSLEEYLSEVQKKNKTFQSFQSSDEAASVRYDAGNLELSPFLTAGGSYLDDKSQQFATGGTLTHQQVRQYNLGLAKKFSTGTQAAVVGAVQAINLEGVAPTGGFASEFHTGTLALSLSQSLWKDFFGRSTRLRWARESSQRSFEKTTYNLQAKQALITAESIFWDLSYLQRELEIGKASLDRAKKIELWVRRRANNGIGDRADVLNAQGLVSTRELQLLTTMDNLKTAERRFNDQMELPPSTPVPNLQDFEQERPLNIFVAGHEGRIVRLESYLSILDAQVKKINSEEAVERVRPDLVLQGQYKTNGYDSDDPGAVSRMTDRNYPISSVGVTFSWALDWESKNAIRDSAKSDALAAQFTKERQLLESESAWSELNRRHQELNARIKLATSLSEVQTAKAAAERVKLSRGRSITSDVITAEQDAADAELNVTRLKAEQRKLESQGRLFVKVQEET